VDLVDDPDLEAVARRAVAGHLPQLADAVDAVFEAPSISWTSMLLPSAISRHESQASPCPRQCGSSRARGRPGAFAQLRALARIRAVVVLPTPRAPERRKAWPIFPARGRSEACG